MQRLFHTNLWTMLLVLIGSFFVPHPIQSQKKNQPKYQHVDSAPESWLTEVTSDRNLYRIYRNGNEYRIVVTVDSIEWKQFNAEERKAYPGIPGAAITMDEGKPVLPVISLPIALPRNVLPEVQFSQGSIRSAKSPGSPAVFSDIPKGISRKDVKYVRPDFSYPAEKVFVKRIGSSAFGVVKIFPVTWNGSNDRYEWSQKLELTLTFAESHKSPAGKTISKHPAIHSVINPEMAEFTQQTNGIQVNQQNESGSIPGNYYESVRLTVSESGMYRIRASTLMDSLEDHTSIDPQTLRLFHRGKEQHIYVKSTTNNRFRGTDYLEFYAEIPRGTSPGQYWDPYNSEGVYWLVWGHEQGKRFAVQSAEPAEPNPYYVRSYSHTIHFEDERYFERLGDLNTNLNSYTLDNWFHSSPLSAGTISEFPFSLPGVDNSSLSDVRFVAEFRGLSTEQAANHQAELYLNDRYLGRTSRFQNKQTITFTGDSGYPNQYLVNGTNRLGISVTEISNEFESLALNWFEVTYDRLFEAHSNFIEFTAPEDIVLNRVYEYTIENFADPNIHIYRNDGVRLVDFHTNFDENSGSYRAVLQMNHRNPVARYYAASNTGVKPLETLEYVNLQSEQDGSGTANYLIIMAEEYTESVDEWVAYRESQGWRTKTISLETIYREYNYGYRSPRAIREAISVAYRALPPGELLHVLLIGGTNTNLRTAGRSDLPMPFFQTYKYGASATDYYYANLDTTDLLPEAAVGRIPVSSSEQLEAVFAKIQAYETEAPYSEWRNKSLFIAGYDQVFKEQTEDLIRFQAGEKIFPERLLIDLTSTQSRFYGGSAELLSYFNSGVYHVNFMGHGGGAVWADRSLFLREDISQLRNETLYPFVTSMTCFTGAIESGRGLGELMLREPEAGAIGWYGSSGLGWIWNDYLLMYDLPKYLQESRYTLGNIVNLSRIHYIARAPRSGYSYLVPTMIYQYNLIGDPATTLAVPENTEDLTLESHNIEPGDPLSFLSTEASQTIIQIYDSDNIPLFEGTRQITWNSTNEGFEANIEIPASFQSGQGHVTYYQFSENGQLNQHGSLAFSTNAPVVDEMTTVPAFPRTGESIQFECRIRSDADIDSVVLATDRSQRSIPMVNVQDELWRTAESMNGFPAGTQIQWWVELSQANGTVIQSPREKFQVGFLPDLYVESWRIQHGMQPTLVVVVQSSEPLQSQPSVSVRVQDSGKVLATHEALMSFGESLRDTVLVPFINPGNQLTVEIQVDSSNDVPEEIETNNTVHQQITSPIYAVTPSNGLTLTGNATSQLNIDSVKISVPGGSVTEPNTVSILPVEITYDPQQWQMVASLNREKQARGFEIDYPPGTQPFPLHLDYSGLTTDSTGSWYVRQTGEEEPWLYLQEAGEIVTVRAGGVYSLFRAWDSSLPVVSSSVGEQQYLPEMYVGPQPAVRFIVEDSVGVDARRETLNILIDGESVSLDGPAVTVDQNSLRNTNITIQPELTPGSHTIEFSASDIHGNRSEPTMLSLVVDADNRLIDYGNFPNPFGAETWFYYEITSQASAMTLDIFTVDGRRIRRFSPESVILDQALTTPGFHKIRWDGRDRNGRFISNGVYFYKITVKMGSKNHESIGKIAKAR
ncbi:MAG: hypothetical protein K9N46_04270 [Candidatus Marinimicrobia bacterium]|nr:hypothetical protein [Candidatus Neomarinimicrobiota bacterium]MCF7828979.1 hypothetical protein [Candidatus Neomarinimicrobiota bacterium]MCF7879939.1 hypothetical protein [Candidatus Neomarinimicrobiota bacterium]